MMFRGGFNRIEEVPGDKKEKKTSHWKLFLKSLPYLWPKNRIAVRVRVVASGVLLALGKFCELAVPFMLALTVDAVSDVISGKKEQSMNSLIMPILLYSFFSFMVTACTEYRNIVFAYVAARTERQIALDTFRHLQQLSLRFHLNRKTGSVIRSVSRGASSFANIARIVLFQMIPVLVQVIVVCAFLLSRYAWYFSVVTFCTIFFYFVFTFTTTEWRNKFRRKMNETDNDYNQKAVDALLNFETVKYFNAERHEISRFDNSLLSYQDANVISQQTLSMLNAGQTLVIAAGTLTAMLLSAKQVVDGNMTVGDFVLINQFILTLYAPLGFLGTYYRMFKQTLVDVEMMFNLMEEAIDVADKPDASRLQVPHGEIRFDNVTFAYGDDVILKNISFTIKPGQRVAVVGKSGAGKSTLARLIYRFYDVKEGSITIDGQDIRDVTQSSLRRHIAIVPQDCVLFNDNIGYNINYGKVGVDVEDDFYDSELAEKLHPPLTYASMKAEEDASKPREYSLPEVEEAAKMAAIHDFVKSQKEGYDTQVGERGLRLSGGEKQRVAIARAILKRPKIIVFDEATSSLDTNTEREIQEALDRVAKGRTSLTIAHRLSTIVNCDNIIVLKAGSIFEQGTHDQLLAIGPTGEYYRMWQRQQQNAHLQAKLEALKKDEDAIHVLDEKEIAGPFTTGPAVGLGLSSSPSPPLASPTPLVPPSRHGVAVTGSRDASSTEHRDAVIEMGTLDGGEEEEDAEASDDQTFGYHTVAQGSQSNLIKNGTKKSDADAETASGPAGAGDDR